MLQPQQFIRVIENIITEIGTFVRKCYSSHVGRWKSNNQQLNNGTEEIGLLLFVIFLNQESKEF